jgi:hypothetical protein
LPVTTRCGRLLQRLVGRRFVRFVVLQSQSLNSCPNQARLLDLGHPGREASARRSWRRWSWVARPQMRGRRCRHSSAWRRNGGASKKPVPWAATTFSGLSKRVHAATAAVPRGSAVGRGLPSLGNAGATMESVLLAKKAPSRSSGSAVIESVSVVPNQRQARCASSWFAGSLRPDSDGGLPSHRQPNVPPLAAAASGNGEVAGETSEPVVVHHGREHDGLVTTTCGRLLQRLVGRLRCRVAQRLASALVLVFF